MKFRKLGNTGLIVSEVALGTMQFGGKMNMGNLDQEATTRMVKFALDKGVNFIDTADVYSLGESETLVGNALKGVRKEIVLATKVRLPMSENLNHSGATRVNILREVEDSLRRLQVEAIDLYQIHWPVEDADIEEGWTAMADLQRAGKVRHIGVSNFSVEQMERCLKIAPITSLQPPYSLLNRAVEAEILPFCMDHGIGVINYSPQASGLLTGAMTKERVANLPEDDFRRNAKQFQEPLLSRNLALADLLRQIGARRGVSAGVVAIAWTLANPAITAAIVGGRSPQQVEGVWPAVTYRLTGKEMQEIQSFMDSHP